MFLEGLTCTSDETKTSEGMVIFYFGKWWRHMKTSNRSVFLFCCWAILKMENWRSEIEPQQCLDWALNIMAWGITSDKLRALALETVLVNSLVSCHFFSFSSGTEWSAALIIKQWLVLYLPTLDGLACIQREYMLLIFTCHKILNLTCMALVGGRDHSFNPLVIGSTCRSVFSLTHECIFCKSSFL